MPPSPDLDHQWLREINRPGAAWLDGAMGAAASRPGQLMLLVVAALFIGLKRPTRWLGALTLVVSVFAADQAAVLASSFHERARPCSSEPRQVHAPRGCPEGPSFPSREAAAAGAAALVFSSAAPTLSGIAVAMALLASVSPVYFGEEWPSDAVVGLVLGVLVASGLLSLSKLRFLHPRNWG